jgi:hypothetical protein
MHLDIAYIVKHLKEKTFAPAIPLSGLCTKELSVGWEYSSVVVEWVLVYHPQGLGFDCQGG